MARKSSKTMDPKDLKSRERKEKTADDVIKQYIESGTQIQGAKQLIALWEGNLGINDGIAIHTNFDSEQIDIFVGIMRTIKATKSNIRKIESLERVTDRFVLRTTDTVGQLEKRELDYGENHEKEIRFLQGLQKTIILEMQALYERAGRKKDNELPSNKTEEEQQEIMSDYSLKNLLANINVVGIKGGLASLSKRLREKIDGNRKESESENTTEKRREELTGDMSLEKRIEFFNTLIGDPNPHFKSAFVLSGHEETLDGYIFFSSKDESDSSTIKEPTDLFVAEAFYELGDTGRGAYGCATYILQRDKISLFLFGKDGKSGRTCLRELAHDPQERVKIIEHYPGQENVRKYHEAIADPEKAIREKLKRTGLYASGKHLKSERKVAMNNEQDNKEYNRMFMEELNENVLNGILTEEEIEECLKNNRGRVIKSFDFDHLYRQKAYRETNGTNREMIIESLRNAGKIENLTPEKIETEAQKVYFYIISTKKISTLYSKGYETAKEVINEAVSKYQEYLSELEAARGREETTVIEDIQEENETLEEATAEEVTVPQIEDIEELQTQEETETGPQISATALNINALLQEREEIRQRGKKLEALSAEYDEAIAKMDQQIAELQGEKSTIDTDADAKRQEALEEYHRRLKQIDEEAKRRNSKIDKKIRELAGKREKTQGLREVTNEGTDEARRMIEEKNAEMAETLDL